jgi:tetratricopeptide (TPR) repeat protein
VGVDHFDEWFKFHSYSLRVDNCPGEGMAMAGTSRVARGLEIALLIQLLACPLCASQAAKPAQEQVICKGPAELETAIANHPSAAAYDALGVYFGSRKQSGCAFRAFQKAVQTDPQSGEAHYDLGLALLNAGRIKESVVELLSAVEKMPSVTQVHTALAVALDRLNQRDAAIAEFQKALRIDPKSITALSGISKTLISERRYKEAVEVLNDAPANDSLECDLARAYSAAGETDLAMQTMLDAVKRHPVSVQAHLELGLVYRQQDRNRNAVEEFQRALELDPSSDDARVALLQTQIVLGDYASAEGPGSEYLRGSPEKFEAVVLMGEIERGLGKYAQALILFRRAVRMNPRDYKSHYGLGFVLLKQGQPREAALELRRALEIKADSGEAHFQLAAALRALGRKEEAEAELGLVEKQKHDTQEEDVAGMKANEANRELKNGDAQKAADLYREALAEDPHNAHTFYNLALALEQLGDSAAERSALESALAIDPKLAPAHNLLGLLHFEAGETQQAEQQLTTAVSLDPDFSEAYRNLAVLDGQQGKPKEAEEALRRAIQIDPRYVQAHIDLALLLKSQGRLDEAAAEIGTAIGIDASNAQAMTARGMILTGMNRREDALEDFRKAVELSPNSAGAHMNLGIALADKPDLPGALAEFSQAVRLAPSNAAAHYNLGRVFYDQRHYDQAKPELTAALALDPQIGDAHYLLGMIEEQGGDENAAESNFRKAVALMPQNGVAVYMLGQSLQHKGKKAEAVECWRKAIALNPEYADSYYSLARATAQSNPAESQASLAKFQQLQDKLHNNDRAEALGSLALTAAAQKDWPQAIAQLLEGIRVCADCNVLPILHKDLGIIYCQSGDWKNGLVELEQSQKLAPNDPEIVQSIRVAQNAQK